MLSNLCLAAVIPRCPVAPSVSTAPAMVVQSEYRELVKEHEEVNREFVRELARVERQEGADAADAFRAAQNPRPYFVEVFSEEAVARKGQEAAVPFLQWLVRFGVEAGDGAEDGLPACAKSALSELVKNHARSTATVQWIANLAEERYTLGEPRTRAILDAAVSLTTGELRPYARFSRGMFAAALAQPTDELRLLAIADLKAVSATEGLDALYEYATGALYELEHLQIGMKAPNIVGEDTDGVEFKLSDYAGKVVLLDFWGHW